jgi:primosomal protein N' (replication factor Y)
MPPIAKVVVELALDREFDYLIPSALEDRVRLGSRVHVPFGRGMARGYVVGLADRSDHPALKTIESLVGDKPLFSETSLKLARWIADYYAATVEQAIRAMLPCAVRRHGAAFRTQASVRLADPPPSPSAGVAAKPLTQKQQTILDKLHAGECWLSDLLREAGCTAAVVQGLVRRGLVCLEDKTHDRDPFRNQTYMRTLPLAMNAEQAAALAAITGAMETGKPPVVLLHGVTSSGKTEVYLQAIQHGLDRGRGAIVLVPEISLTPQTVARFRGRFGDTVAVLHSQLSDGERHDEWYRLFEGKARIAVGARSALFAPVSDLGLIIVDEEHEPSYKQAESPRYNARDVAVMRGRLEGCPVLLGSASPAIESFQNVRAGKYALAVMARRVDERPMPVVRIVDMRVEAQRTGKVPVLSRDLVEAIRNRLATGEQTILFLNRRGYASSLLCPLCGYVAACEQCSVSMTYHRATEDLRCHLCGALVRVPNACPGCGDKGFKFAGLGTQRVETVMASVFPSARIRRMDLDTTRRKEAYETILGEFRARKIDILIGTQMIAKGHHFPGVTLVGVVNADLGLHLPDFRAGERTFQLLVQVAGRAGRGEIPGEVIVQTFTPEHPAIQAARALDYGGFLDQELAQRRELGYPPFTRLMCLTLEGPDEAAVATQADVLAARLRQALPAGVILAGPAPAALARVKGRYRYQVILRAASASALNAPVKSVLRQLRMPRKVALAVDMDALSLL